MSHTKGRVMFHEGADYVVVMTPKQTTGNAMARVDTAANGRRITACWNACDGCTTEALESYAKQGGWAEVMAGRFKKRSDDRDSLLAALHQIELDCGAMFSQCSGLGSEGRAAKRNYGRIGEFARAAIAKHSPKVPA